MRHVTVHHARHATRSLLALLLGFVAVCFTPPQQAVAGDRPDINTFTPAQRADLFTQMSSYITSAIILEHLNPPANKHGSARFMVWHRDYIKDMEDFLIAQNRPQFVPLPKWNPNTTIPAEFLVGGGVDPDCPTMVFLGHNCNPLSNSSPGINLPASLSTNLCLQTNFASFRSTLENGYHDGVHVSVGGAMGAFKSPAAPIFWLWHAFVDDVWFDWQCTCGLDEGTAFSTYTAAEQNTNLDAGIADAWIQDSPADIANEPNNETGSVLWESTDIWVRNSPAMPVGATRFLNEHQHQNPEYAAIPANRPYIYVKVRNRGCVTVNGTLRVYWANASTGLIWPTNFTEVATSPVTITNLSAGREHVGQFHWLDIPQPTMMTGDHFCLIARFEATPAAADPIIGESIGVSVWQNVKNSNQIAWKNLTIVDNIVNNLVPFIVRNVSRIDDVVQLAFAAPPEQRDNSVFGRATVQIALGDELFARWLQNGAQGNGIEIDPRGFVRILADGATIDGLPIPRGTEHLVNLQFEPGPLPCEDDRRTFDLRVALRDREQVLGGNTYELRPRDFLPSPEVLIDAVDPVLNCQNGVVRLRLRNALPPNATAQWLHDGVPIPGATGAGFQAREPGNYSLLITYSNGCNRESDEIAVYVGVRPTNDDPCAAIVLETGHPMPFDIHCATAQPGEPAGGVGSGPIGGCQSHDGWCASDPEVQNSVWFLFVAPPSGVVTIHAGQMGHDEHDHDALFNTQLAVYDAGDCADFRTYRLLGANDDSGNHGIFGTDPALHDLSGLTPGRAYLVQVDGWRGALGSGEILIEAEHAHCPCDWNDDGALTSQDFFDFLASLFMMNADINGDGKTNSQDFFDFLACFFNTCP